MPFVHAMGGLHHPFWVVFPICIVVSQDDCNMISYCFWNGIFEKGVRDQIVVNTSNPKSEFILPLSVSLSRSPLVKLSADYHLKVALDMHLLWAEKAYD